MKKEKIHIEYILSSASKTIIWSAISTPSGLETWFADKVEAQDKRYTFKWGKTESRKADVINIRANSFVRFHWTDEEDPKNYFEFKMNYNEMTGEYTLEITDFAEPEEIEDQIGLWNSQIETLKRVSGM